MTTQNGMEHIFSNTNHIQHVLKKLSNINIQIQSNLSPNLKLYLLTNQNEHINKHELKDLRHCLIEYDKPETMKYALDSLSYLLEDETCVLVLYDKMNKKCLGSVTLTHDNNNVVEISSKTRREHERQGINGLLRSVAISILPLGYFLQSIVSNVITFFALKKYEWQNYEVTLSNTVYQNQNKNEFLNKIKENATQFNSGNILLPINERNKEIAHGQFLRNLNKMKTKLF